MSIQSTGVGVGVVLNATEPGAFGNSLNIGSESTGSTHAFYDGFSLSTTNHTACDHIELSTFQSASDLNDLLRLKPEYLFNTKAAGRKWHAQCEWDESTTWLSTGMGKAVYATLATLAILASTILSMSLILPAGLLVLSLCLPFLYIYAKKSVAYLLALTGLKSAGEDLKLFLINSAIRRNVERQCDQLEKDQESRDQRFEEIGGYFSQDGLEKLKGEAAEGNITIAERLESLKKELKDLFRETRIDLLEPPLNTVTLKEGTEAYHLGIKVRRRLSGARKLVDLRFVFGDSLYKDIIENTFGEMSSEEQTQVLNDQESLKELKWACELHVGNRTINNGFVSNARMRNTAFNEKLDRLFWSLDIYLTDLGNRVVPFLEEKFVELSAQYYLESDNVRDCADLTRLFVEEYEDELHSCLGTPIYQ